MRKIFYILIVTLFTLTAPAAHAILNMELTQGFSGAEPIAIVPFAIQGGTPLTDVAAVVSLDLQNSGHFKLYSTKNLATLPHDVNEVEFAVFRKMGVDNVVVGKVQAVGNGQYQVQVQLLDAIKGKMAADGPQDNVVLFDRKFTVPETKLRSLAHHISDLIYQQLTGVRGIFSTRLAYVMVERDAAQVLHYSLIVSDQDGYNPKPLLVSSEPIMSPSWSPDGKQVAYVSFENKRASIYIEEVATGKRRLISSFPGINGAPAWSPDGQTLALVLSKSGAPNLYLMNLNTLALTQLTNDYYINTEPAWAPDGQSIIFTSTRSGNPQIYQIKLSNKSISRVTYDGKYNARASFTPDGNHIIVLNQEEGLFNIGILDLDSGVFRVLTNSGMDNESPSTAPNGTMVLFGTLYKGKSVLGMIATDGSVQVRLPTQNGDVQDPAWSPFLS